MKYRLLIVLLITILLVSFFCASPDSKQQKNSENLKKVKIGMKMVNVTKIMGQPDTVIIISSESKYYYRLRYEAPSGMSGNISIYMSRKDSLVTSIYDGR